MSATYPDPDDIMMVDETMDPTAASLSNSVSRLPPGALLPPSCQFLLQEQNPLEAVISAFLTILSASEGLSAFVKPSGTHEVRVYQFSDASSVSARLERRNSLARMECFRLFALPSTVSLSLVGVNSGKLWSGQSKKALASVVPQA
jgi:hypothetical protein